MNQLDAVLVAKAHQEGRALRSAAFRHRRLVEHPMVISLWQLGSEPFSAAAIGFGERPDDLTTVVAGDPRSRDLAFAALMKFAAWFLPRFEGLAGDREVFAAGASGEGSDRGMPQIVVPNRETIDLIGRLGRRLAYLPTTGERPAPTALVRLGQHLQFLARHAEQPGQQLIVPMGGLVADHWVTPQTEFERSSFAAVDAFVDPPAGLTGFEAAAVAEVGAIGPAPSGDDDRDLDSLVSDFNTTRNRGTDPALVEPLLGPILAHYRPLVARAWALTWRALERERTYPEATSVGRRWEEDRRQYERQMDWVARDGRVRTRQTARQAIDTMRRLEEAKALVVAEEALDDPIRMIPYLLDGKAVEGKVVALDPDNVGIAKVKPVRRPLVTIHSDSDRFLPTGKEFWSTVAPDGPSWRVHSVAGASHGGTLVTLALQTSTPTVLPRIGTTVGFSIHNKGWRPRMDLGTTPPWPLRPAGGAEEPRPIEADGADVP